jgi:hypothetical protein
VVNSRRGKSFIAWYLFQVIKILAISATGPQSDCRSQARQIGIGAGYVRSVKRGQCRGRLRTGFRGKMASSARRNIGDLRGRVSDRRLRLVGIGVAAFSLKAANGKLRDTRSSWQAREGRKWRGCVERLKKDDQVFLLAHREG